MVSALKNVNGKQRNTLTQNECRASGFQLVALGKTAIISGFQGCGSTGKRMTYL